MSATTAGQPPATMIQGATLRVQDGASTQQWHLGQQPASVGRRPDNDIVLSSRFVSGQHARIEPAGMAHRIIDLNSTNGLLFTGRYISEQVLKHGDVIRIGDPNTGNFVTLTYENAMLAASVPDDGATRSYSLPPNQATITIGRTGCTIELSHPQVSRLHAQLNRAADGSHTLVDSSTNGTFVNGQRISQQALQAGDTLRIGPFKFIYRTSSLDAFDEQGELYLYAQALTFDVPHAKGKGTFRILHDISLSIAPREFVALVGGSGAGKSTLLKALSGYTRATGGHVLVNEDDFYQNFDAYRTVLGYVPQDDIIHPTLTVERTLDYTSKLRLPTDMERPEVLQRIERVLDDVEMEIHKPKVVNRLSGGQRKRVSMAVELLAEPSLFFLDEATSGLDPGLEKKTMYMLRRLADSGRTILLVTHATDNIVQCDHVAFLSKGRLVYFGPPREALTFFGVTSGDFADIYTRLEGEATPDSPLVQSMLHEAFAHWKAQNPGGGNPLLADLWQHKYRYEHNGSGASLYQRYVLDRQGRQSQQQPTTAREEDTSQSTSSPLRQWWILTRRYLDLLLQDRRNLLIMLLQVPIIAIVLIFISQASVLLAGNAGIVAEGLIQRNEAKTVLFMITVASIWFGAFNSAREIAKELPIFVRERLVNLSISAYMLSKVAVLGLFGLLQSALFLLVLSVGITFPNDTGVLLPNFPAAEMFVTVFLSTLASTAIGLFISALVKKPNRAFAVVPLVLILQIVFAGLIFEISGLLTPLSWLTVSRWSMDALGTSIDLKALCYLPNFAGFPSCASPALSRQEPDAFLPGAFVHEPTHLLLCWGILLLHMAVFLGLTIWQLRRSERQF